MSQGPGERAKRARMTDPAPPPTIAERLISSWRQRTMLVKALSFGAIGVLNTLLDFSVFWTAYNYLGIPLVGANVLAWLVAVSASYVMNSFITFARESGKELRWRDYATFVAAGVPGVIANTTALTVATWFLPVFVAKLIAIVVSFLVNFSLSHFVVFRPRRAVVEEPPPRSGH
jgi:putative flippase GtrA